MTIEKKRTSTEADPSAQPLAMQHILILRHGETDANKLGITQGHSPTALNELGHLQALHLAKRMIAFRPRIDALISSDLPRTLQTAQPIAEALDLPVHRDPAWRERCYGIFEGTKTAERFQMRQSLGLAEEQDPPGAQSLAEYEAQIHQAFLELPRKFPTAHCIAVVTHGGACRAIMNGLINGRLNVDGGNVAVPSPYPPNCSITHLVRRHKNGNDTYSADCIYDIAHLKSIGITDRDFG